MNFDAKTFVQAAKMGVVVRLAHCRRGDWAVAERVWTFSMRKRSLAIGVWRGSENIKHKEVVEQLEVGEVSTDAAAFISFCACFQLLPADARSCSKFLSFPTVRSNPIGPTETVPSCSVDVVGLSRALGAMVASASCTAKHERYGGPLGGLLSEHGGFWHFNRLDGMIQSMCADMRRRI